MNLLAIYIKLAEVDPTNELWFDDGINGMKNIENEYMSIYGVQEATDSAINSLYQQSMYFCCWVILRRQHRVLELFHRVNSLFFVSSLNSFFKSSHKPFCKSLIKWTTFLLVRESFV